MAVLDFSEEFPVVNERGEVIGKASRRECHSGSKLLHPVVHLHVFDAAGNLFLQKRSLNKDIQPGRWDTSVGGHVDYGETINDALVREACEELGLNVVNPIKLYDYIFESSVERELVNTFKCVARAEDITVDEDEISEGRFFSFEEIESLLGSGKLTPNFEIEYSKLKRALKLR